jgi:hypothetical protein
MPSKWQDDVQFELQAAKTAARENMEGRSRVSARRAAGRCVLEYFNLTGDGPDTSNFYELIQAFAREPDLPDDIRVIAGHLCQRVDRDHTLPGHIDLITEAKQLVQYLSIQIEEKKEKGF